MNHVNNFGKYPSSKSLCKTLTELNNKRLSAKFSSIYSDYRKNLKFINSHVTEGERSSFVIMGLLIRNWALDSVDDVRVTTTDENHGDTMYAYEQIENVIKTDYKELLRKHGINQTPERYKCQ